MWWVPPSALKMRCKCLGDPGFLFYHSLIDSENSEAAEVSLSDQPVPSTDFLLLSKTCPANFCLNSLLKCFSKRGSIASRALDLHKAELDSIPGIPDGPLGIARNDP